MNVLPTCGGKHHCSSLYSKKGVWMCEEVMVFPMSRYNRGGIQCWEKTRVLCRYINYSVEFHAGYMGIYNIIRWGILGWEEGLGMCAYNYITEQEFHVGRRLRHM